MSNSCAVHPNSKKHQRCLSNKGAGTTLTNQVLDECRYWRTLLVLVCSSLTLLTKGNSPRGCARTKQRHLFCCRDRTGQRQNNSHIGTQNLPLLVQLNSPHRSLSRLPVQAKLAQFLLSYKTIRASQRKLRTARQNFFSQPKTKQRLDRFSRGGCFAGMRCGARV